MAGLHCAATVATKWRELGEEGGDKLGAGHTQFRLCGICSKEEGRASVSVTRSSSRRKAARDALYANVTLSAATSARAKLAGVVSRTSFHAAGAGRA